jgi:hypothetical protein
LFYSVEPLLGLEGSENAGKSLEKEVPARHREAEHDTTGK